MLTMPVRAHHRGVFRERIADHRGRNALGAKHLVAPRIDQRNLHNFLIAERDHALAQAILRLGVRQAVRGLLRGRQARRKFVVAVVPRDFFDQVDAARHVAPPGRLLAFPHRISEPALPRFASLRIGLKSERAENFFDVAIGNVRAHHAQQFLAREARSSAGASRRGYTSTTPARISPPATCWISSAARREASSAISGSAPRSKR